MKKVLIADDFEDNIFLLEQILELLDYECTSVINGQEAVDEFKAGDYDLVLLDIEMPVMNGFEAAEEIKAISLHKGQVPIIAISAHSKDFFDEKLSKSGFDDYISKPYTLEKLQERFVEIGIL